MRIDCVYVRFNVRLHRAYVEIGWMKLLNTMILSIFMSGRVIERDDMKKKIA